MFFMLNYVFDQTPPHKIGAERENKQLKRKLTASSWTLGPQ